MTNNQILLAVKDALEGHAERHVLSFEISEESAPGEILLYVKDQPFILTLEAL